MFRLIQTTPIGGDCTCGYRIELSREDIHLGDFIKEVFKRHPKEWGCFEIKDQCFWYKNGKLEDEIPMEFLIKKIKSGLAHGGWGRMDYMIST